MLIETLLKAIVKNSDKIEKNVSSVIYFLGGKAFLWIPNRIGLWVLKTQTKRIKHDSLH